MGATLQDLVLDLKGLVHVRAILELRGVSAADLEAHDLRTANVRAELARRARGRRGAA